MKANYLLILILFSCTNSHVDDEYFSVEKSKINTSYGRLTDNLNFYKFQRYYQSIRVDSLYLENYHYNFEDTVIYNFLINQYHKKGYAHSINILTQIGRINAENFNDTGIIVLDLNDSISLVNLSAELAVYPLGTCCSPRQNLIIRKRNNSICYNLAEDELLPGRLLGIYVNNSGKISGLLMQNYSNNYSDFYGLNSSYNLRYNVSESGIIPIEILNVRNGEPFDKNDTSGCKLMDFGIKSYYY